MTSGNAAGDLFGLIGSALSGKYRVDRVIGEGGYGVVYAGRHLSLDEPVAIKCFKFAGEGGDVQDTFLREARVLFTLTHPNIVRMYDVDRTDTPQGSVPYVVLEFLDGVTLDRAIERRARGQAAPFTPREILAIFEPVVHALSFAHARGIAHRDLKPSNVMLVGADKGGLSTKLLDFGTARQGGRVTGLTATNALGFTPRYAAPEQWDPSYGTTGPASDVFALGLMLAEVCTSHPVLQGSTPSEIVREVMDPERRSLVSARRYDLPPGLDDVVTRATRVRPPERFASVDELLEAVRRVLGVRGGDPSGTFATPTFAAGAPRFDPTVSGPMGPPSPMGGHVATAPHPGSVSSVPWMPPVGPPMPMAAPAPVPARSRGTFVALWVALFVIFGMFAGCAGCVCVAMSR